MNKKWFTLIELMIVVTIVWIMMMMVYAPYNYYKKKAQVKIAAKNIEKVLYIARNNAIYWANSSSWNLSVWVYFEKWKNELKVFNYPFNYWTWAEITLWNNLLKEEINIWKDIELWQIEWQAKVLFLFSAINGKENIFDLSSWSKTILTDSWSDNIINIDFSYKWATLGPLSKTLKYYLKTHISDY